jgi:hypothetical protein
MDTRNSTRSGRAGIAVTSLLVGAFLMSSDGTMMARSNQGAKGLVGTWAVQVTLRDCTTNAALGPASQSLGTFHQGGTLSDTTASLAFAIGQRSPAQGTWSHEGKNKYIQHIVALVLFDTPPNLPGTPGFDPTKPVTPGFLAGWQSVRHIVRLTDTDHWISQGTSDLINTSGDVYRTGCSSATAERLE